jgi:mannosidase alpha-like ER degradation enhancer 2
MDTWGSFSLTLVDALDTLVIMGNDTEFRRAADVVLNSIDVDANVNVSVFETNIRVVGGLLTAHMLSGRVKGQISVCFVLFCFHMLLSEESHNHVLTF